MFFKEGHFGKNNKKNKTTSSDPALCCIFGGMNYRDPFPWVIPDCFGSWWRYGKSPTTRGTMCSVRLIVFVNRQFCENKETIKRHSRNRHPVAFPAAWIIMICFQSDSSLSWIMVAMRDIARRQQVRCVLFVGFINRQFYLLLVNCYLRNGILVRLTKK